MTPAAQLGAFYKAHLAAIVAQHFSHVRRIGSSRGKRVPNAKVRICVCHTALRTLVRHSNHSC
eukprot:1740712-Lingulodinium_polyedra.AAC.1